MEIEELPIDSIVKEERARKEMGDLEVLAENIRQHGIIQPITINQYKRLIAGERRLEAAKLAGLITIPCVVRNTTGKADKKEIELFENIHRKDMNWQERNSLVREIHELRLEKDRRWTQEKTGGILGITQQEVSYSLELAEALEIIPDLGEAKDENSARKMLNMLNEAAGRRELASRFQESLKKDPIANQETVRVSGYYIVGDALEKMAAMEPEQFDFAEVDPPYGVKLEGHKNQTLGQRIAMEDYREVTAKDYRNFLNHLCIQLYRVMKDHTYTIIWYGFEWHGAVKVELEKAGFAVTAVPAIWVKWKWEETEEASKQVEKIKQPSGMASQPDITLSQGYEQFMVARKGQPKLGKPGRGNVFAYKPVPGGQKLHPTEKPKELMKEIVDTFCIAPGSRILCPFLGSGVTILAAVEQGHTAEGWDLSKNFKGRFEERVLEWAEARRPKEVHAEQMERLMKEAEE